MIRLLFPLGYALALFAVPLGILLSQCTPAKCAYCPSYQCTATDACGDCSCVKGPNELVGECMDLGHQDTP